MNNFERLLSLLESLEYCNIIEVGWQGDPTHVRVCPICNCPKLNSPNKHLFPDDKVYGHVDDCDLANEIKFVKTVISGIGKLIGAIDAKSTE